jgi:hypothetical protein
MFGTRVQFRGKIQKKHVIRHCRVRVVTSLNFPIFYAPVLKLLHTQQQNLVRKGVGLRYLIYGIPMYILENVDRIFNTRPKSI